MNSYKKELAANRRQYFKKNMETVLRDAGVDPAIIRPKVYREMCNLQNRTRGQLFELMGEVLTVNNLRDRLRIGPDDKPQKQKTFITPHGRRRNDLYYDSLRLAVEVKSGYVYLNKSTRAQIEKDRWLLQAGYVEAVVWLVFRGGSSNAIAALKKADIETIDIEWDK